MRVREAKDFLVQQAAQQAAIEGVPLSDFEKRMMYFTESEDAVEDPIRLNQEFEAQFDTDEYELKISGLLRRAYERTKEENPASLREWDEAVRELRKGDHYVLVLWDLKSPTERPRHDSLKLLGTALLVAVIALLLIFGCFFVLILVATKSAAAAGIAAGALGRAKDTPPPQQCATVHVFVVTGGQLRTK
jgi:hypothetical protein